MSGAACEGLDTELFFDRERLTEAREVCLGCSVRDWCRGEADKPPRATDGVWGGEWLDRKTRPVPCGHDTGRYRNGQCRACVSERRKAKRARERGAA